MEDEGHLDDHFAGASAVDGKWHHVAVTWESSTGKTVLYDNGKKVDPCHPLCFEWGSSCIDPFQLALPRACLQDVPCSRSPSPFCSMRL